MEEEQELVFAYGAYKLTIVHPTTKEESSFIDLPEPKGMWKLLYENGVQDKINETK